MATNVKKLQERLTKLGLVVKAATEEEIKKVVIANKKFIAEMGELDAESFTAEEIVDFAEAVLGADKEEVEEKPVKTVKKPAAKKVEEAEEDEDEAEEGDDDDEPATEEDLEDAEDDEDIKKATKEVKDLDAKIKKETTSVKVAKKAAKKEATKRATTIDFLEAVPAEYEKFLKDLKKAQPDMEHVCKKTGLAIKHRLKSLNIAFIENGRRLVFNQLTKKEVSEDSAPEGFTFDYLARLCVDKFDGTFSEDIAEMFAKSLEKMKLIEKKLKENKEKLVERLKEGKEKAKDAAAKEPVKKAKPAPEPEVEEDEEDELVIYTKKQLNTMELEDLKPIAEDLGIEVPKKPKKDSLIEAILAAQEEAAEEEADDDDVETAEEEAEEEVVKPAKKEEPKKAAPAKKK